MKRGVKALDIRKKPKLAPIPFLYLEVQEADVVVVGPPSSGTRLLTTLLEESGLKVVHDASHGKIPIPPDVKVVKISRDKTANAASIVKRDDMPFFKDIKTKEQAEKVIDDANARIQEKYPDAIEVTYESLVAGKQKKLDDLADYLGAKKWKSGFEVRDENAKHDEEVIDPPKDEKDKDDKVIPDKRPK